MSKPAHTILEVHVMERQKDFIGLFIASVVVVVVISYKAQRQTGLTLLTLSMPNLKNSIPRRNLFNFRQLQRKATFQK
jgi:hypothetical protein